MAPLDAAFEQYEAALAAAKRAVEAEYPRGTMVRVQVKAGGRQVLLDCEVRGYAWPGARDPYELRVVNVKTGKTRRLSLVSANKIEKRRS